SVSDLSGRCGASISIESYFGTKVILSGSSRITRPTTTYTGVTAGRPEVRRLKGAAYPHRQSQNLTHILGGSIATAYFRPQLPPELEFDTDMFGDGVQLEHGRLTRKVASTICTVAPSCCVHAAGCCALIL